VAAGAELEEAVALFGPSHWTEALGSSGTIGAVSDLLKAQGRTDGNITPQALAWLIERCVQAGHVDRLDLSGLKDDRRAVLPGGIAILYTLAAHFGIGSLQPALGALRQGLIVDLHERQSAATGHTAQRNTRQDTVRDVQARFGIDQPQAARVRAVATHLYRQACPGADTEQLTMLGWACDLHELGMALSHHDHHRHSAYMLAHLDAPGFSQSQQRQLADLVLAQRGGLRKVEHLLGDSVAMWQVLCLRLASIRCHARQATDPSALTLQRVAEKSATLSWHPTGASPDLRTSHLLREECAAWARNGALQLSLDEEV
jgi:exopolyphosphatase/guanosine-5'-triphosphate,3'-diphosphate pyrophosphatase